MDSDMSQIILIEDDRAIADPLVCVLEESGYTVELAHDGLAGLQMVREQHPDLVLLDVLLPQMDGWEVCKEIRRSSVVPILMLTALGDEVNRILGLELGADDYQTKPFSTYELLARIKALLRRVEFDTIQPNSKHMLVFGELKIDLERRLVIKGKQELKLRYKEFELLSLLVSHAGEVVTRAEIFDKVWGTDWLGDMRTLDVHVRWLREKLEVDPAQPRFIQTVRGVGYRFVAGG
jgi:DNA-binding response OmpR family regulator